MPVCLPSHPHPGYAIELNLLVNPVTTQPAFWFEPNDAVSAAHSNSAGDLDFSDSNKPVAITINLFDGTASGLQFAPTSEVIAFAKDYGFAKYPVRAGHFQVWDVQVTPNGTTVTFCYRNTQNDDANPHLKHTRSAYGLFLADQSGNVRPVDPGIGNGGNQ